jgi:Skp family chaperone for outer membrane proteins
MSTLTAAEEKRIAELEISLQTLLHHIEGAGTKNMLNRLNVVFQRRAESLQTLAADIQTEVSEILDLVRKAQ